jgi:hypothetical protein
MFDLIMVVLFLIGHIKGNLRRDPCPYSYITQTDKKQIIFKILPLNRVLLRLSYYSCPIRTNDDMASESNASTSHAGSRLALVLSIHLL